MTFTFTIDCFPAYTKFDKTHKVLAELITLDPNESTHPYSNEDIIGHIGRESDADTDDWYTYSVFGDVEDGEPSLKP